MDLGIRGRTALVAGASSGLGYAIAQALLQEGVRVVIASRSRERVEAAAAALHEATGGDVRGAAIDVTDPGCGEQFVNAVPGDWDPPTILVTNAGGPRPGPFADLDLADFESAVQLSFLSAVRLTRAALPAMRKAGWGRVIHITSATVHQPSVGLFLSSSVRPAVAGFSKALATEVAPEGITVNLVAPGLIATERLRELAKHRASKSGRTPEQEFEGMAREVPQGRIGEPRELAATVAFLCSEPAGYINGVALRVDGGRAGNLL